MNTSALNRDGALPIPPAGAPLGDRPVMAIGIPAFGFAIPLLTGLHGAATPADGAFWAGSAYFVA
ncbi:MAG: hypothetical protein M3Y55_15830, partial [Pseudomonadota bacterium]|nr:hypothetical protein [Pseudomonadota bacterium]